MRWVVVMCLLSAACARRDTGETIFVNARGDTLRTREDVRLAGRLEGFYGPESVRYDEQQDIYFVSNMMGPGSSRDGAGFISRVRASDLQAIDVFIESGRDGVTLNAPKGMAIQADTLWVTDIDVIRGFNRHSGKPVRVIDVRGLKPQLLNDVAVNPDGTLYVTDTGIAMTDKGVLHPGGDRVIEITAAGAAVRTDSTDIGWPNGVTWDGANKRWIVVDFHPFTSRIHAIPADGGPPSVLAQGNGRFDGVELLRDGSMLVTAWNDHTLYRFHDGRLTGLIGDLTQPADIGIDTRRNRVAIPLALQGRVDFWTLGASVERRVAGLR